MNKRGTDMAEFLHMSTPQFKECPVKEILCLAAVIVSFAEITTTSIRSAITKNFGNQDVGKVIEVSII